MILLFGIATEEPLAMVADALRELGAPFAVFHQRRWAECDVVVRVDGGSVDGRLRMGALELGLEDVRAAYTRLMDERRLPEVAPLPAEHPARRRCRAVHDAIAQWQEVTGARVVNRGSTQGSNGSKPFQAQIIAAHGLRVPETLVTNEPRAVLDFRARHGRVVFKSISGARSIVRDLEGEDLHRLERIRWCPVQFQAFVPGTDVRVHCVGDDVYATRIETQATDYRYAAGQGESASLTSTEVPGDVADRCVELTTALGLELSGIDLRVTPDGEWYCFEVNPSPAFSYYEAHTGQPIARAIARHLAAA